MKKAPNTIFMSPAASRTRTDFHHLAREIIAHACVAKPTVMTILGHSAISSKLFKRG